MRKLKLYHSFGHSLLTCKTWWRCSVRFARRMTIGLVLRDCGEQTGKRLYGLLWGKKHKRKLSNDFSRDVGANIPWDFKLFFIALFSALIPPYSWVITLITERETTFWNGPTPRGWTRG